MSTLPEYVTRTQIIAASEALGIDPANTDRLDVDWRGVTWTGQETDTNGKPEEITRHIPIGHGPNGDQL